MKTLRLLLSTFVVLAIAPLKAQTIQYAVVSDYPTLIANIFGIQCDGVSNVQITGSPAAIGRFENGQAFGLNSGLALSTGELLGSNQASSVFYSSVLNTAPDNDIAQFGTMNGQIPTNFDATAISFDFTPSTSDSISFSYMLASEEYPEFSNSSFTDRFLFLVSENGAAATNIAFVPGTTIPVEINSINQTVNAQYYVDNLSGMNANTFVFDGYTVPLTATFYAQVGSTYHIKLVIADVSDAAFDSAIFLDEQEAYNTISGSILVNNTIGQGVLEVFNFVQDTLVAAPVQTLIVNNGTFNADSLSSGLYHVRFTPDTSLYPNTPPVYFTSGSDWTTATAIGLPCFLTAAGLSTDSLNVLNGSGTISGTVSIDTSFLKSLSVPFENASVYLHDQSTNALIAFTRTNSNGSYQLNNIPSGTYYIRLDVPYLPQLNNHALTILDNQTLLGADFDVLTDGIHALNNTYLSVNETALASHSIYPNPVQDELTITSNHDSSYTLRAINGQIIQQGTLSAGLTHVSMDQLTNGLYLITFDSGETLRITKK